MIQNYKSLERSTETTLRPDRSRKRRIPQIANKDIPVHTAYGYSFAQTVRKHEGDQKDKIWSTLEQHAQRSLSQKKQRHMFNLPENLLRKYLIRKQKQPFGMNLLLRNVQSQDQDKNRQFKTANDFRIKKSKRSTPSIGLSPDTGISQENSKQLRRIDENFMNFTYSKNLYEMTFAQLQRSINWKKQFLQNFDKKIREIKTSSVTNRMIHF